MERLVPTGGGNGKRCWTQDEVDALEELVPVFGKGRWEEVLEAGGSRFVNRTEARSTCALPLVWSFLDLYAWCACTGSLRSASRCFSAACRVTCMCCGTVQKMLRCKWYDMERLGDVDPLPNPYYRRRNAPWRSEEERALVEAQAAYGN